MTMEHITSSGSLFPDLSLIDETLSLSGKKTKPIRLGKNDYLPVWTKAIDDLHRLGTLRVNETTIYSGGHLPQGYTSKNGGKKIFRELVKRIGETVLDVFDPAAIAICTSELLEQN